MVEAYVFLNVLYGFKKDTFNLTWYIYEKALQEHINQGFSKPIKERGY